MCWRRTDPVQDVGAMILIGPAAFERLASALSGKSALFRGLLVEHNADWAVVFAAPLEGVDGGSILPRIEGATPLYLAAQQCWLPVGVALDAPDRIAPGLWVRLREQASRETPLVFVPRFRDGPAADAADVYLVRRPAPLVAPQPADVL
jgi:hypothetical protein